MKLSDDTIDRLRNSVNRLVEKNRQLEHENQRLTKLSLTQSTELAQTKQQLEEATAQLNVLSLSGSLIEISGGTKIARQRINSLLRDIDRCLSFVNK